MTDKREEALRREIMAIIELLLRRKSHTSNKIIRVIATVEVSPLSSLLLHAARMTKRQ
jgi:hypothetical protein